MALPSAVPEPPDDHDRSEFEQLVHEHQTSIWRYLRFLGCSRTEADDLTQDSFVAVAQRSLHRFGLHAARAYLRRVARNAFLKLRKEQRASPTVDLAAGEAAFDWFLRDDDGSAVLTALRQCLTALTPEARRALTLRYADQIDRRAIARQLGMSEHGVKSLLQRSYARLRVCIDRRLEDD